MPVAGPQFKDHVWMFSAAKARLNAQNCSPAQTVYKTIFRRWRTEEENNNNQQKKTTNKTLKPSIEKTTQQLYITNIAGR